MAGIAKNEANLLFRTLPAAMFERVTADVEEHPIRTVLIRADETPKFVFFPHGGSVASIVRSTLSGQMVEAGVVGREGAFSLHSVLAPPTATGSQAIVQSGGAFSKIEVGRLGEISAEHAPFRAALLAYASVFLDQVTQNLVCNRWHPIEQRLAKWLLMMRDRVRSDELALTQEFLGYMLGAHRPAVSVAVSALEGDGVVRHRRNALEIVTVEGVAERSCECYQPLRARLTEFEASIGSGRVLPA